MEQADEGGHAKNLMLEVRIHRHTSSPLQTRTQLRVLIQQRQAVLNKVLDPSAACGLQSQARSLRWECQC